MKKLLSLVLILMVVLTACGGTDEENAKEATSKFSDLITDQGNTFDFKLQEDGQVLEGKVNIADENADISGEIDGKDITVKIKGGDIIENNTDIPNGYLIEEIEYSLDSEYGYFLEDVTDYVDEINEGLSELENGEEANFEFSKKDGYFIFDSGDYETIKLKTNGKEMIYTGNGNEVTISF